MFVTFTGSTSAFFGLAFFGNNGLHVDLLSLTPTTLVVEQPDTGVITSATGTGFAFGTNGQPTAGTVNSFSFSLNGSIQATITGISWNLVQFNAALEAIDQNDDNGPMAALFSLTPITIDGSGASAGIDLSDLGDIAPLITSSVTVIGTDFDDILIGGGGNDSIDPGANDGYDLIAGTLGNDVYDFSGADYNSYYQLSYEWVMGAAMTLTLDSGAGTATVTGVGTDTLNGIGAAMSASDGGLSIVGTNGDDTFNIINGYGNWGSFTGGMGNDTFNLTLDSGLRLDFRSTADEGATQGLVVDLETGVVSNDGFGFTDQINVLDGDGRLEIRGTDHADDITGSERDESFILRRGNDTLDGGDGFDRLRYDRSGVESVSVNLETGVATGTWYGNAFSHEISNIEWVRGSRTGDDTLIGDGDANRLDGRGGNDTLTGGGGRDTLDGGEGNDLLNIGDYGGGNGGSGNDTYDFSSVTTGWAWVEFWDNTNGVTVTVNGNTNTGTATSGGDTDTFVNVNNPLSADGLSVSGGSGDDTFNITLASGQWMAIGGHAGADSYNLAGNGTFRLEFRTGAGATVDLSTGTVSDDGFGNVETINGTVWELRGSNANDNFTGSANNESFILQGGTDTLDGGDGFDRLRFDRSGNSAVTVNLLNGTATGTFDGAGFSHSVTGIEWVRGSEFADMITGNNDANLLEGRGGNDSLYGLGGNDTLTIHDGAGLLDGGADDDVLIGDELNDTLYGGGGNDLLDSGDGNDINWAGAGDDTFFAGNGDDLLGGGAGNDLMWGGAGNDSFYAGDGDDTLGGGDGNDELWTGTGNNVVYAGAGDDTLGGSTGNDELWGGTGNNLFYAGAGADTLGGDTGNDEMWSGDGDDVAYGAGGMDTISGGAGNDELWAGEGNDIVYGDAGADTMSGASGDDTLWGGAGNDVVIGADGNDQLSGGDDNDTVWAGDGNDVLWGNAGDDNLNGVGGDDTLVGHEGNDTLNGGDGADSFVFRTGYGADVVGDFDGSEGDTLLLDDALWATSGALTAAQVVAQFGSLDGSGNVVLTFDGGETLTLNGVTTLTGLEADISII